MDEYADDYETATEPNSVATLAEVLVSGQKTTPEAVDYASKILNKQLGTGQDDAEQAAYDQLRASAEQSKKLLREARARVAARQYAKAVPWLTMSAGLSRPTKTGTFAESAGNLSAALLPYVQDKEKFKETREKDLQAIDTGLIGIDAQVAERALKLQEMRRRANSPLAVKALDVLGRELRPGPNSQSNYGKIAQDEGLKRGTPEYEARVTQLRKEDLKVKEVTAGMDATGVPPEEKARAEYKYGVPAPPIDPYEGLSIKGRQQAQQIEQRNANSVLAKQAEVMPESRDAIKDADRFMYLNEQINSGYFRGKVAALADAEQEVDAITARLSRKMRSPGEGTTSDWDAKQFVSATLSRGKNFGANQNLATAIRTSKELIMERYNFMQDYMALHGHLRGAETMWKRYLDANPIFDPKARTGSFILNPVRKTYQDFFRSTMPAPAAEPEQKFADGGRVRALKTLLEATEKVRPGQPRFTESVKRRLVNGKITSDEASQLMVEHNEAIKQNPVGFYADGGVVDQFLQGASMGLSDELSPDTRATRADLLRQESTDPIESATARSGGTAALLLAGYQAAKKMGMTDAAIRLIPQSKLIQLALAGSGAGFLMGAGRSEGPNSGLETVESTILGAGAGALSGLATKYGVMSGIDALQNRLSRDPVTGADRRLLSAMDKDKMKPGDMLTQMKLRQASQLPTMAVDLVGPHAEALAGEALTRVGPGTEQMAENLSDRQSDSRSRVTEHVNKALKPDEFFSRDDALTDELYTNAKPIYEAAYEAHPKVESQVFDQLLQAPDGKRAVREAVRIMRNEGKKFGAADITGMLKNPSLEFLDNVKRGLDDLIKAEETQGGTYQATNLGRTMRGLRSKLLTELDDISPEYKEARAQYAGDLETRDALRSGREEFASLTPEEIRRKIGKMSFSERDAFRSGVAQNLFEKIGQPSSDINAAQNIAGSPDTMARLEAMFEKPQEFKIFKTALDRESRDFKRNKTLLSSASRGRSQAAGASQNILGAVDESLAPFPLRYGAINTAMSLLRFRVPMSTKTANRVSDMLATSSPEKLRELATGLERKSAVLASRKGRAGKVAALAAVLGGALATPSPKGVNLQEETAHE